MSCSPFSWSPVSCSPVSCSSLLGYSAWSARRAWSSWTISLIFILFWRAWSSLTISLVFILFWRFWSFSKLLLLFVLFWSSWRSFAFLTSCRFLLFVSCFLEPPLVVPHWLGTHADVTILPLFLRFCCEAPGSVSSQTRWIPTLVVISQTIAETNRTEMTSYVTYLYD